MKTSTKKILAILMVLAMSLTLSGCKKDNSYIIKETTEVSSDTGVDTTEAASTEVASADSENEEFNKFLQELFVEEVSSDTLTLHYTLKNPESYNIQLEPTFGDLDFLNTEDDAKENKEIYDKLTAFDITTLSEKQQLDYNILKTYLEDNKETEKFNLYSTAFGTVSGVQCNMPINLAEYKFYVERDITDYLSLVNQIPTYFDACIKLEQARVDAGLGLQDFQLEEVIDQCEDFISVKESNYMISTFNNRIDAFDGLDNAKKEEYKSQNKTAILDVVIPAYQKLITDLSAFKGKATISGGVCNLKDGKEYYEKLVRYDTGSTKTIEEMIDMLDSAMSDAMTMMYTAATLDAEGYQLYFEDGAVNYGSEDPLVLLDTLQLAIIDDYPLAPQIKYSVNYVQKELEETMSPAFYMIPPIDGDTENTIYINNGSTDKSGLFTTLAHEGYPGHMYQNNYYISTNPNPIRHILSFDGYSEGWATYVELQSPSYFTFAEHDQAFTLMAQAMTQLNLVVSTRLDIGVNYEGWTLADVEKYLTENGLNAEIGEDIYEYVICEPANYLKYCVSALEFMELQAYAKTTLGDKFVMKDFNKALLDCGPCQFEYVKASVDKYIEGVQ